MDDVTGEVLGYLIEKLMQAGALDVSVLPALMKKGRAGFVIRAIARHEETEMLAGIIIRETGSLGVRIFPSVHRLVAEREQRTVQVEVSGHIYPAQVKVSRMEGKIISVKPEYEDCKKIADEIGSAPAHGHQKSGRGGLAGSRPLIRAIPLIYILFYFTLLPDSARLSGCFNSHD